MKTEGGVKIGIHRTVRINCFVGETFYQNVSIETSFDPPLFSLDSTFKMSIIWICSSLVKQRQTNVVLRRLCELVPAEGVPVLERSLHPRDVAVRRGDGLSGRAGRVAGALQRH